jgi:hypothetical protein
MQAQALGGVRSAVHALPSTFTRRYVYGDWISILQLTVYPRCFAGSILSRLSLGRRHSSLMSAKSPEPPSIPGKRRRRKVAPTTMEAMEARLNLLTTLIAASEGRTDLTSKQRAKRDKNIWEKARIEIRIEAYKNGQTFAPDASANMQPSITSEQSKSSTASSTHRMRLRSANIPATQINARKVVSINTSVHEIPARPTIRCMNRSDKHSVTYQDGQMTLPIRSSQPQKRDRDRDEIVPPSAASGGVPEPSLMYRAISALELQTSNVPQHLLLIIDLNGTLLYRPNRNEPFHFVERPSTQQFLNYALANFSVMIWSSARPENVDRMCKKLFSKESRQQLVGIWGRDRLGLSVADSNRRVQVYKRLETVWSDPQIQGRHPLAHEGKGWHQGNTVLIDDSIEKSRSEPYNFIEVPEFSGHEGEDPNLLKEVAEYLAILRMQSNVSSYISRNPRVRRNPPNQHREATSSGGNSEPRHI